MFFDETRYHLSHESFGCPPCPNGCVNPLRGKQCYCIAYDEIIEKWEKDFPVKSDLYGIYEDMSIRRGESTEGSVFGSKKCPCCRVIYKHD